MRLRLLFEPDRADFSQLVEARLDADVAALEPEPDQSELTARLRGLYGKYAQSYTNRVSIDPQTRQLIPPDYPALSFQIDGEENSFLLDNDLFERLCDLYILYGWRGIQTAEKTLSGMQPKEDPESAG